MYGNPDVALLILFSYPVILSLPCLGLVWSLLMLSPAFWTGM